MTDVWAIVASVCGWVWGLVPLQPVYPSRGNGIAASIVGALVGLGLLAIVAKFATTKPKNRRRR